MQPLKTFEIQGNFKGKVFTNYYHCTLIRFLHWRLEYIQSFLTLFFFTEWERLVLRSLVAKIRDISYDSDHSLLLFSMLWIIADWHFRIWLLTPLDELKIILHIWHWCNFRPSWTVFKWFLRPSALL